MAYITEAHSRLIAKLCAAKPAHISTFPTAAEFDAQKEHLETVAALFDDYLHAVAIDAASNSHEIKPKDFVGAISTALHDQSLTAQFTDAADCLRHEEAA